MAILPAILNYSQDQKHSWNTQVTYGAICKSISSLDTQHTKMFKTLLLNKGHDIAEIIKPLPSSMKEKQHLWTSLLRNWDRCACVLQAQQMAKAQEGNCIHYDNVMGKLWCLYLEGLLFAFGSVVIHVISIFLFSFLSWP